MCGRINQHMFEKLYDPRAIEFIKKHSMDQLSSTNKVDGGAEEK